jgi:agmatine deiminase
MPVPTTSGGWVQFRYTPDYLRPKRWQHTLTDGAQQMQQLGMPFTVSDLVVDGGNVVLYGSKVLMTDKVLRESPAVPAKQLLRQLADALEVERIVLLPADPLDLTGHADGLVHLLDERTVLVNDCRQQEPAFWHQLETMRARAGYECIPLPYNPYHNPSYTSAVGTYLNFLYIGTGIIVPTYGQAEDEPVLRQLHALYPRHQLLPVQARALAQQGGVFHCITWTSG